MWHSTGIPYRKQPGSFGVTQEQGVCQSTSLDPHHSPPWLFFWDSALWRTSHVKDIGSMEMNSFECGMWNPQAWGCLRCFIFSPSIELSTAVDAPVLTEVRSSKNWNPSLEVLLWVHTAKVVGKLLFIETLDMKVLLNKMPWNLNLSLLLSIAIDCSLRSALSTCTLGEATIRRPATNEGSKLWLNMIWKFIADGAWLTWMGIFGGLSPSDPICRPVIHLMRVHLPKFFPVILDWIRDFLQGLLSDLPESCSSNTNLQLGVTGRNLPV